MEWWKMVENGGSMGLDGGWIGILWGFEEKPTILRKIFGIGTGAAKNGYLTDKAMLWLPSPKFMPKCSLEQDGVDEILNQLVSIRGDFVTKVDTV
jgi:hypothetical protein